MLQNNSFEHNSFSDHMAKIRVTKEYKFEMAHALWNYDGLCKNLHGHSYRLFVTVIGEPNPDENDPKFGMVLDFSVLKKIINEKIVNKMDHTVVVSSKAPIDKLDTFTQMFHRLEVVDYQPTCENMVVDFVERIKKELPGYLDLFSVKLYETATSYAEWYSTDNE